MANNRVIGSQINVITPQTTNITNASLTGGKLTLNHNLNTDKIHVQVVNDTGYYVLPDGIKQVDNNNVEIDLASFGSISNTWKVIIK